MLNSKLNDYTQSMNVYELNRFYKYIQSPLYNEDDKLRKFVAAILTYAKNNELHQLENQKIWKFVFGSTPYNRTKFIRLLSDTVKKVEHFLIIDRFQQQKVYQQTYLIEIMNERKLDKHVPELMNHTFYKHEKNELRDSSHYYINFLLQQQKNLHLENRELRSTNKNIEEVINSLDVFYFINKLKYGAALLHYKNFLSIEADTALMQEVLQEVEKKKYEHIPIVQMYRFIILSFTKSENQLHYQNLKSLILLHSGKITISEAKTVFSFAMNYCINQINLGHQNYLEEALTLYKQALQNDFLLEDGQLSQWDYKNITTVALRVKDYQWVKEFIENYKKILPEADRQNAYRFNLARYFFYMRKYDRVLQLLQTIDYNDIFYQLDSKTTLLKTYYELGEWQPLYSLKDSFRILLRRKKLITPQQKTNYMNLLKLTLKLLKCDVNNKHTLKQLKLEIETTQNVADKSWLLEKMDELQ